VGFYRRRANRCDRFVRMISLRLDGEASEMECAALDRHLANCARCSEIAAENTSLTRLLRTAPLVALERPVVVTSPQRVRRQRVRVSAAVCVVAAGLSVAGGLALFSGADPKHPNSALGFRSLGEQKQFVRAELLRLEPNTVAAVQTAPRFVGHGLL
jgi:anti-sigma factor RsiW